MKKIINDFFENAEKHFINIKKIEFSFEDESIISFEGKRYNDIFEKIFKKETYEQVINQKWIKTIDVYYKSGKRVELDRDNIYWKILYKKFTNYENFRYYLIDFFSFTLHDENWKESLFYLNEVSYHSLFFNKNICFHNFIEENKKIFLKMEEYWLFLKKKNSSFNFVSIYFSQCSESAFHSSSYYKIIFLLIQMNIEIDKLKYLKNKWIELLKNKESEKISDNHVITLLWEENLKNKEKTKDLLLNTFKDKKWIDDFLDLNLYNWNVVQWINSWFLKWNNIEKINHLTKII